MLSSLAVSLLALACLFDSGTSFDDYTLDTLLDEGWPLLDQTNNALHFDVYERFRNFTSLENADNVLTYQMPNGGWLKNYDDTVPNPEPNEFGRTTFDNDATWREIIFCAQVYRDTGNDTFRDAALRAMEFTLEAQYPSGGWPQVYDYPIAETYWTYATINDDVHVGISLLFDNIRRASEPFGVDFFDAVTVARIEESLILAIDFLLKSQYVREDGTLTIWAQQYDPVTLKVLEGRTFERPALTMGWESPRVVMFLMTLPQSPPVTRAVDAALQFILRDELILEGFWYDQSTEYKFQREDGQRLWYRFYELERDVGFFSDFDALYYHNILQISEDRRNGYTWAANLTEFIVSYIDVIDYDYTPVLTLEEEFRDEVVSGVTDALIPQIQANIVASVQEMVASLREEISTSEDTIVREVQSSCE